MKICKDYLFTSESVSEGHPDKVADQISDAILDAYLLKDPFSRVACEVLVTEQTVILAGEVSSSASIGSEGINNLVRKVIEEIGYTDPGTGFDHAGCRIENLLHAQATEIGNSVATGGAGDQGIMFGYACRETEELMPLPLMLSHKIMMKHSELRKSGRLSFLKPDAKSQVTVRYQDERPVSVETVLVSSQHDPDVSKAVLHEAIIEELIKPLMPSAMDVRNTDFIINPSGSFTEGGPATDTGLTGRKIIVDTYGGRAPHGGGAFSGKDPTKVDRSGAYAARYLAKNFVAHGLADTCLVQLSYAIGRTDPVSVLVSFNNNRYISLRPLNGFLNLTPSGIIEGLQLRRPIYRETASFGHFGRSGPGFTWEKISDSEVFNVLKARL